RGVDRQPARGNPDGRRQAADQERPRGAAAEAQARADRAGNAADVGEQALSILQAAVQIQHHVADLAVRLAVLRGDIDAALRHHPGGAGATGGGGLGCAGMRGVPGGRGGRCPGGRSTAPTVEPLSEYSTNLRATSVPMRSCASSVEPPTCGVRMTLSRPCSGVASLSAFEEGSTGKTSMAAPASRLARSAAARALRFTTVPGELLMKSAPGFMRAISASPIMPCVAGVSGT